MGGADQLRKKVLVIEDEYCLLDLTKRLLESRGYEVITLMNGERALDIIKKELPHLILLDVLLPGKSGDEILQEIRLDDKIKDIPVIITTGQSEQNVKARTAAYQADIYLIKPFEISDLLKAVGHFVNQQSPSSI